MLLNKSYDYSMVDVLPKFKRYKENAKIANTKKESRELAANRQKSNLRITITASTKEERKGVAAKETNKVYALEFSLGRPFFFLKRKGGK